MIITTGDKYLSWTPARANKWAALSAHYPSSGLQDTQNPSSRKAKVTSNASMSYLYRTVRNPKSRYHCLQQTFLSSFVSWMDWRDILYIPFPCLPVSLKENYSFSFYLKYRETETRRELLFPSSLCKCPSQSGLGQPKPGAGHLIWDPTTCAITCRLPGHTFTRSWMGSRRVSTWSRLWYSLWVSQGTFVTTAPNAHPEKLVDRVSEPQLSLDST